VKLKKSHFSLLLAAQLFVSRFLLTSGAVKPTETLRALEEKEKEMGIRPDPEIDAFLKVLRSHLLLLRVVRPRGSKFTL
jgi:hypothetical protein